MFLLFLSVDSCSFWFEKWKNKVVPARFLWFEIVMIFYACEGQKILNIAIVIDGFFTVDDKGTCFFLFERYDFKLRTIKLNLVNCLGFLSPFLIQNVCFNC